MPSGFTASLPAHGGGTRARLYAIDPIQMLVWSAVLNGIVAVPIMAVMMVVVTRLSVMGRFSAKPVLTFFGWAGTALMAVTVVALFWSSFG
jgi:Mn2+/Fe2+ NRAMP family transporter